VDDDPLSPLPESPELLELLAMDPAKIPPELRPLVEELRRRSQGQPEPADDAPPDDPDAP